MKNSSRIIKVEDNAKEIYVPKNIIETMADIFFEMMLTKSADKREEKYAR